MTRNRQERAAGPRSGIGVVIVHVVDVVMSAGVPKRKEITRLLAMVTSRGGLQPLVSTWHVGW